MLRHKNADETWSFEEMLKEQIAFETHEFGIIHIVHADTNKPYYAHELCESYHSNKCNQCIHNKELALFSANSEKKEFIPMNGRRKKFFNQSDVLKIKEMSKNGISNRKIAKKFNCSEKTIRNYLKET